MRFGGLAAVFAIAALSETAFGMPLTPEQLAELPPPASHPVNFSAEIKPIFESSCIKCHGRGKDKGGFRLDNRDTLLKGGDSGAVIVPGKSSESLLVSLVQGFDPDSVMPKKGSRLTPEQIGILRAWIDQGAVWDPGITFGRLEPLNLTPRLPSVPPGRKSANPIDRFLAPYFATHKFNPSRPVSDRVIARRVWLDIIGLLPPPEQLDKFLADKHSDKRARLVDQLLGDDRNYAEHWLTFWNDLLRNDYKGTGYIDGGRKQITSWLYSTLLTNMSYDKFVAQLVNPSADSEGFTKGIVWRGVVNASQTPQMQAAQNISQVFMGVNLKCASCHDSFVNDFTLADAYGLAGIYADGPLEMVHCDKPTGKKADLKFIYPEIGDIDPKADKTNRLAQLARLLTDRKDGRLTRTFVNRLWERFFGRGLVEPVDDMEKPAWNPELLDWLAEDFAAHNYDVRFLIQRILTSRAYQMPAVDSGEQREKDFVFRGPFVRRMDAEQFRDALTTLAGAGYSSPNAEINPTESEKSRFGLPIPLHWIWNDPHAAEKAPPGHVYFRKIVHLGSVPSDATAVVVCDNSFTLFVNGQNVGSGADFKHAFLFDIRTLLKSGDNTFAVDAVNHLPDGSPPKTEIPADSDNPAGLLFYARIRCGEVGHQTTNDFASDKSWISSTNRASDWHMPAFAAGDWKPTIVLGDMGMIPWRVTREYIRTKLAASYPGRVRASFVASDPLLTALGRPNREQVVTVRSSEATTLQALEMTNGQTLSDVIRRSATNLVANSSVREGRLVASLYEKALSRKPTRAELRLATENVGGPAGPQGVEDLIWAITMLPEFQLIY